MLNLSDISMINIGVINNNNNRYSTVIAVSKRTLQLINGSQPLINISKNDKPLSIAIKEFNEGKINII